MVEKLADENGGTMYQDLLESACRFQVPAMYLLCSVHLGPHNSLLAHRMSSHTDKFCPNTLHNTPCRKACCSHCS